MASGVLGHARHAWHASPDGAGGRPGLLGVSLASLVHQNSSSVQMSGNFFSTPAMHQAVLPPAESPCPPCLGTQRGLRRRGNDGRSLGTLPRNARSSVADASRGAWRTPEGACRLPRADGREDRPPEGYDRWDRTDDAGWTVPHMASCNGTLPQDVPDWALRMHRVDHASPGTIVAAYAAGCQSRRTGRRTTLAPSSGPVPSMLRWSARSISGRMCRGHRPRPRLRHGRSPNRGFQRARGVEDRRTGDRLGEMAAWPSQASAQAAGCPPSGWDGGIFGRLGNRGPGRPQRREQTPDGSPGKGLPAGGTRVPEARLKSVDAPEKNNQPTPKTVPFAPKRHESIAAEGIRHSQGTMSPVERVSAVPISGAHDAPHGGICRGRPGTAHDFPASWPGCPERPLPPSMSGPVFPSAKNRPM
jgi:hypothetical protein